MKFALALLLICLSGYRMEAQSAAELLKSGPRIRGIVVPLMDTNHACISNIRIDRIYTETGGTAVFEGVTIEIPQTNRVTNCLNQLNRWFTLQNSNRLELRYVTLEHGPDHQLEAGRVQFGTNGVWNLLKTVTLVTSDKSEKAPQARFYTVGERSGELVLMTSTNRLFFGAPSKTERLTHAPQI